MNDRDIIMPDGRTGDAYLRDYELILQQVASGTPPAEEELARAPLVFNWKIEEVVYTSGERYRHIFGNFEGHPFIVDQSYGRTSPLLQLDRGMTWARCRSRVYRLRDPYHKWQIE